MLTIDGRTGGGQLLRTALGLSILTATPFRMVDARANRPNPGLKPQHVTAVTVMADLCDAEVSGMAIESTELTFAPDTLAPASTTVDIGTAGSVGLLFDTVLPLATRTEGPFSVTATGGTDVKWAPTMGYVEHVKLPLLRRFGFDLTATLERTGFYPAGGGEATLHVGPSSPDPLDLDERGALDAVSVFSKASTTLAEAEVADRQARRVSERLEGASLPVAVEAVDYVEARSTGSSLLLRAAYERSLAGVDELGERGKPSEAVADDAVDRLLAFHDGPGAVDAHMGDQVLVPLALAGGTVLVPRVTDHVASSVDVIERFGRALEVTERSDGSAIVEAGSGGL